jgi:hypothetical protein
MGGGDKIGYFRCVVPDLEHIARKYISELESGKYSAGIDFIQNLGMGYKDRPRRIKALLHFLYGSRHWWMWDAYLLRQELSDAGFTNIRQCQFNDCKDEMFKLVEESYRFEGAIAFESQK